MFQKEWEELWGVKGSAFRIAFHARKGMYCFSSAIYAEENINHQCSHLHKHFSVTVATTFFISFCCSKCNNIIFTEIFFLKRHLWEYTYSILAKVSMSGAQVPHADMPILFKDVSKSGTMWFAIVFLCFILWEINCWKKNKKCCAWVKQIHQIKAKSIWTWNISTNLHLFFGTFHI